MDSRKKQHVSLPSFNLVDASAQIMRLSKATQPVASANDSAATAELKDQDIDTWLDEFDENEQKMTHLPIQARRISSPPQDNTDWHAIELAIQERNTSFIKKKIASKDMHIDAQNPSNGKTLLIYAVIIGDLDLVRTICNFGGVIKVKDNGGMDALDYALKFGRYKIIEIVYHRTLSGSLGNDLKEISKTIHRRTKECEAMEKSEDNNPLMFIYDYMIEAVKGREPFDECMLFYAWYHATHYRRTKAKPFECELWTTMMSTYEEILANTDDKKGWRWLKDRFVSSFIWYMPHPGSAEKGNCPGGHGLTEFETPNRFRCDDCKTNVEEGTTMHGCRKCDYDMCVACYDAAINGGDEEEEEKDDAFQDGEMRKMEETVKETLFYELLSRVRAESKKQSELLLKANIEAIKLGKPEQWQKLTSFDVRSSNNEAKDARQDLCGCLVSKYSEIDLSEVRYPPSTHFSAKKHYDANIYLNELLFKANILDKEFQATMQALTKHMNDTIGTKALFRAGPVKTLDRSQTKVENDYIHESYPTSAKILDLNRCAIQFDNTEEMMLFIETFMQRIEENKARCIKRVIRCKNGWQFFREERPQYTDVKLNVLVASELDANQQIIAEVQFLLSLMSSFKKKAHKLYSVERKVEMVFNFGELQQTMTDFHDNADTNAVFKDLVLNDDAKHFRLLWTTARSSFDALRHRNPTSKCRDDAVICVLLSESDQVHQFLLEHAREGYAKCVLGSINKLNQIKVWKDVMKEFESDPEDGDAWDTKKVRNEIALKNRFGRRLLALFVGAAADNFYWDLDDQLRPLNIVKGLFETSIDRYVVCDTLVASKIKRFEFGFDAETQLKFIEFSSEMYVFGKEEDYGLLGFGQKSETVFAEPQFLNVFDQSMMQVSCGENHTLVLDVHGSVYAWGSADDGQIGFGQEEKHEYVRKPRKIPAFSQHKAVQVCAGSSHSLILTADGNVWSFGSAYSGRLGHGNETKAFSPKRIEEFVKHGLCITDIAAGNSHNGAVTDKGELFMWGRNRYGQCGFDKDAEKEILVPTKLSFDDSALVVSRIACGWGHTLILTSTGTVLSHGDGDDGRLGHDVEEQQSTPKVIEALSEKKIVDIACGSDHSFCVTDNGEAYSWGDCGRGKLGHGDEVEDKLLTPKKIEFFEKRSIKIVRCECGEYNSCVVSDNNDVWMFGDGDEGQLGIGETVRKQTKPVKIKAFRDSVIQCVSLGAYHSAVITRKPQTAHESQSEEEEKNESGVDADLAAVILKPNESRPHCKPSKSECLAVYIKNEAIFGSSDWFYITHRRYSNDTEFEPEAADHEDSEKSDDLWKLSEKDTDDDWGKSSADSSTTAHSTKELMNEWDNTDADHDDGIINIE